jgi:hypothetical protein
MESDMELKDNERYIVACTSVERMPCLEEQQMVEDTTAAVSDSCIHALRYGVRANICYYYIDWQCLPMHTCRELAIGF